MSPAHRKPLPPIPTMRPEEVPEKRQEYTRESLLKFKEEKAAREEAERQAAAGLGEGGFFGGFGGGGDEEEEKEEGEDGEEKGEGQEDAMTEESIKTKQEVCNLVRYSEAEVVACVIQGSGEFVASVASFLFCVVADS